MAISAAMVKQLREQTGLPMMECKKALTEAGGDFDGAVAWLKKHASGKMSKMASRETTQGRIAAAVADDGQRAGMVELVCETAPVANTDDFIKLANAIAATVLTMDNPAPDAVLEAKSATDPGKTIAELKDDAFSRIRENMAIKRVATVQGHVGSYVHHNAQVGVLVEFSADAPAELRADICMHIAAINPPYLKREDVPADLVAEERERATSEAAGKPAEIIDKIVGGKLDRWYGEVALLEQPFVKDDKQTVTQVLKAADPELTINRFYRFQIGEA